MPELRDHWCDVTVELETLRATFPPSERIETATRLFDEFLSENELDLALHVLCDALLEADTGSTTPDLLSRLERLHAVMGIADDCVERLRPRAAC
jgi:hypothetical protein